MEYTMEQINAALQDKKITSWCDLYEELGIAAELRKQERYDVQYVKASAETQNHIREILRANLVEKYKCSYRKKTIDDMVGMDFLCFSPTTEKNVAGIKILLAK